METLQMIQLILMLISTAILSCWIAYESTIVQEIKSIFGLHAEMDFRAYKWKWWFIPFLFLWVELRALLNCPFCISVWLGTIVSYFYLDYPFIESFMYSMLCIAFVGIYRKLTL